MCHTIEVMHDTQVVLTAMDKFILEVTELSLKCRIRVALSGEQMVHRSVKKRPLHQCHATSGDIVSLSWLAPSQIGH